MDDFLREAERTRQAFEEATWPAVHPKLVVVPMTEIAESQTDWLWPRWSARGKLHLVGGHAGDGKSTLLAALAASASRGRCWPDGTPVLRPLNTMFILGEDSAGDTLKPRLSLHGADMSRVFVTQAVLDERGEERFFNVKAHLTLLEQAVIDNAIDQIVIDPLTTVMPGSDRNAEGDTRDLLTPVIKMAERLNVAVVGVVHVGKSDSSRRAAQKILGATAFVAMARIVWMIAPDGEDRMALGVAKTNLSMKPEPLSWSREEDGPIVWHGVASQGIEELLSNLPVSSPRADAEGFLREYLAAGMRPAVQVEAAAKEKGISKATLRRAREAIGVRPWKHQSSNGAWFWRLPTDPDGPGEDAQSKMLTPKDTQVSILNTFDSEKMLIPSSPEHLVATTPLSANDVPWADTGEIEDAQDAHLDMYRGEHLRPSPNGHHPELIDAEYVEILV
jgi:energy-coupling factor transporter ATP-binding protein EcfA2